MRWILCLLVLMTLSCSTWWAEAYRDCQKGDYAACDRYQAWAAGVHRDRRAIARQGAEQMRNWRQGLHQMDRALGNGLNRY